MDSLSPPDTPATVFSDDDEYDLISNPGHDRSLDSSLAELPSRLQGSDVPEPPPSQAARDKLETAKWSSDEIQAYVRKTLGLAPETHLRRTVRVYVDGPFDVFNIGNALQLRQAKLAFPYVHLVVGVFTAEQLAQYGYSTSWSELERVEMVRHCRWVDEVVTDVPWEVSDAFLLQRRIDYVAIDEGTSVDPNVDKARVKAYDEIKRLGKVITTRRTKGFSASKRLSTGLSTGPPTPVMQASPRFVLSPQTSQHATTGTAQSPLPGLALSSPLIDLSSPDPVDAVETPEPKLDLFGLDN
ncbi:hypothetical protein D9611_012492 [Ephemerocybe angulata]|uniref:choline-phosphate cytidylyltransferase n=1 Tax=Ephemerocybe angulata TaxID=980116 RepID=A0A8H5CAY4_9AGAR|nr:hypothetical protein D9611_012492 [Tulosesus angulatus]